MFGIGMPELIVILVIMLVVVGPGKLPQLGASLGGAIRNFKKSAGEEPGLVKNGHDENKG